MLSVHDYNILKDPICTKPNYNILDAEDFRYYDKDGFELNRAEIGFYKSSGYKLNNSLNHYCFQQNWISINHANLYLDHCLILHRCSYDQEAYEQLHNLRRRIPAASYIMNTRAKWGFDFALDAVDPDSNLYEVLHIECDYTSHDEFLQELDRTQKRILEIDWLDAAQRVLAARDQWTGLKGFEQNHWKAKFLLGWSKSEYTEKTI